MRQPNHHARRSVALAAALTVLALVGTIALVGCTGGSDDVGSEDLAGADGTFPDQVEGERGLTADQPTDQAGSGPLSGPLFGDRSVIAVANVEIRVDDVPATLARLTAVARSAGGFVAGESTTTDPDDPAETQGFVTLRVPTDQLGSVLRTLSGLGEVLSRQQEVTDVTEEVVDVESRIRSARASVARIRALLDRAQSIGQVVRIESQLAQREADLDSLLARQRALADRTALATVSVSVVGPTVKAPTDNDTGFLVGLEKGWQAFTGSVAVLLTVVGWVLPFAAVALALALPIALAWRRSQRPVTPSPEEPIQNRPPAPVP